MYIGSSEERRAHQQMRRLRYRQQELFSMKSVAMVPILMGALFSTAASSAEQVMSAGDLQQLCAGTDHVSVNVCRVYILGVTEGITLGMNIAAGKTAGSRPCVP